MNQTVKKTRVRSKKWWVILVLVVALALYQLGLHFIPRFPSGPVYLYDNLSSQKRTEIISYNRLSNEKFHPYAKSELGHPNNDYDLEIVKWPDVNSCLILSEALKTEPDLRLVNWDSFKTHRDAEVCLWRIFDSLGAAEKIVKWLDFQTDYFGCAPDRAHTVTYIKFDGKAWTPSESWQQLSPGFSFIKGGWNFNEGCPVMVPSRGLGRQITARLRRGQSVRAEFDDKNIIRKIEFRYFSIL